MSEEEKYPKVYFEDKKKTAIVVWGIVATMSSYFMVESFDRIFYFLPFLVLFGVIIFLYPTATLTLYKDRLEYKRGRVRWSALWSEVGGIFTQSKHEDLNALFIETQKGNTKLIGLGSIKIKGGTSFSPSDKLIADLKKLSGRELTGGDISLRQNKRKVIFWAILVLVVYVAGFTYFIAGLRWSERVIWLMVFGVFTCFVLGVVTSVRKKERNK